MPQMNLGCRRAPLLVLLISWSSPSGFCRKKSDVTEVRITSCRIGGICLPAPGPTPAPLVKRAYEASIEDGRIGLVPNGSTNWLNVCGASGPRTSRPGWGKTSSLRESFLAPAGPNVCRTQPEQNHQPQRGGMFLEGLNV
jgi:hypothetical protein